MGLRALAKRQREPGDAGKCRHGSAVGPGTHRAALVAEADRRAREAEEVFCREYGVSHGQLEETHVLLARGGRMDRAGGGLPQCPVAGEHELGRTNRALGAA